MILTHKKSLQFVLSTLLVLFVVVLAGCASNNDGDSSSSDNGVPGTGGNGNVVNVTMSTYSFQLDKPDIPSGPVTFHVTNAAQDMAHEMVVLKTDIQGDQLPTNAEGVVDEDQLESLGEVEVEVGGAKDLNVNLTPGHYVLLCNIPGHYTSNMFLDVTVK